MADTDNMGAMAAFTTNVAAASTGSEVGITGGSGSSVSGKNGVARNTGMTAMSAAVAVTGRIVSASRGMFLSIFPASR